MTARAFDGEIVLPDGRHELTPEADAALGKSGCTTRTWPRSRSPSAPGPPTTTSPCGSGWPINIPTWLLASGLVALGHGVVPGDHHDRARQRDRAGPMLLNSHAGTKYGIPYPVFARASFGVFGANLPALIRAGVACGWFGIQTWIGGSAIFTVDRRDLGAGSWWTDRQHARRSASAMRSPWTRVAELRHLLGAQHRDHPARHGRRAAVRELGRPVRPDRRRSCLLIWMAVQAGGFGPLVERAAARLAGVDKFWVDLPVSLMGMIAFWSTLSLNMPDFTRFGRSQREQARPGPRPADHDDPLPAGRRPVTSATVVVYGEAIWDPVALVRTGFDNPILSHPRAGHARRRHAVGEHRGQRREPVVRLLEPWPKRISFRTGGLITGVIGILIQPWNLLHRSRHYIFTWLGTYGGATGAIAGVLIADYWFIRQTELHLADLYRANGDLPLRERLELAGGRCPARRASCWRSAARTRPAGQPFPEDGLIPFLKSAVRLQLGRRAGRRLPGVRRPTCGSSPRRTRRPRWDTPNCRPDRSAPPAGRTSAGPGTARGPSSEGPRRVRRCVTASPSLGC